MVAKVTTISIYTTHTVLGLLFYVSCGVEIIVFITVRYQKFYLFVRCIFTTRFRIEPPISNYLTSSAVWSEFEVRTVALTSTSFFGFKLLVRSVSKKVVYASSTTYFRYGSYQQFESEEHYLELES